MEKAKKTKILIAILLTLLGLFIAAMIAFVTIQTTMINNATPHMKALDELSPADAVIILGARVYDSGAPSPILQNRLDHGYAVYEKGLVSKIIVSGDHGKVDYNEVKSMKQYLLKKGVKEEDIFMDHAGFDTYDSMYRARDIFCVKSLIICTQEYHTYRSIYIARRLGLEAQGYPAPDIMSRKTYNNFRESLARVKAVLDVEILRREPKYLGDSIPISGSGLLTDDEWLAETKSE